MPGPSVTWGYGSVGSNGFNSEPVESRWHHGYTHSDCLTEAFCQRFWIPFLRDGTVVDGDPPAALPWPMRLLTSLPLRFVWPVAVIAAILACFRFAPGDTPARNSENANARLASFTINLPADPNDPGIRHWTRPTHDRWIEQNPSGMISTLSARRRVAVNDCDGTIVGRDEPLEVFIPDVNCQSMVLRFRWQPTGWSKFFQWGTADWLNLAPMRDIRTEGSQNPSEAAAEARAKLSELRKQLQTVSIGKSQFVFSMMEKYERAVASNDLATASAIWTQLVNGSVDLLKAATTARNLIIQNQMFSSLITPEFKERVSASAQDEAIVMQRLVDAKDPDPDAVARWNKEMKVLADTLSRQLTELDHLLSTP